MSKNTLIVVLLCMTLPLSLAAQEEEQAPEAYSYATYFYCDTSNEEAADEWMSNVGKPAYDAAVDAGEITAWGWMAHHTGGKWRRILYRGGSSVSGVIAALDAVDQRIDDDGPGIDVSCKSHDDYIWKSEAGSGGTGTVERGSVGMSVYFVCKIAREDRADELVKSKLAPLYEQQVSEGNLTTWGWLSHIVGGKYRRLLTLTGNDLDKVLAARDNVLDAAQEMEGMEEIGEICYSHSDYLWEIQHEKP